MLQKYLKGKEDYFYFVFRIFIGFLFLLHGAQKLFGSFGGNKAAIASLMGAAGIIEFFGGLAIVLGLFTRLAALISAAEMLVAYFMAHAPKGPVPLLNGGELALLYFAGFLVLTAYGAGKWNLDKALFKKEVF